MKCVKCNLEIDDDAQFCPYCGKAVEYGRLCVKCGKPLDDDSDFCPYCGTKQNDVVVEPEHVEEVQPREPEIVQEESEPIPVIVEQPQESEEEKVEGEPPSSSVQEEIVDTEQAYESSQSSKKWLWIIGAILLLGILGGGGYYFMSNKVDSPSYVETDSIAEVGDSNLTTGEDIKVIETRLHKIFSALITEDGDKYLPEYFTEGFNTYYKRACEKAMKEGFESPRIWWQESESDPSQFVINSVTPISDSEAKSNVTLKSEISQCNFEVIVKQENGNWLIDKITQEQEYQQVYEEQSSSQETVTISQLRNGKSIEDVLSSLEYKYKKVEDERGHVTVYWYSNCELDNQFEVVKPIDTNANVIEVFDGMSASVRITVFDKVKFEDLKAQTLQYCKKDENGARQFDWGNGEGLHGSVDMGYNDYRKGGYYIDIPI